MSADDAIEVMNLMRVERAFLKDVPRCHVVVVESVASEEGSCWTPKEVFNGFIRVLGIS